MKKEIRLERITGVVTDIRHAPYTKNGNPQFFFFVEGKREGGSTFIGEIYVPHRGCAGINNYEICNREYQISVLVKERKTFCHYQAVKFENIR